MACGLIPGSSGSTLSGVLTVPGKIPGGIASRPTPAGQQSGVVSLISSSIPGHVVALFVTGGESYSHQRPWGDERFDGRKTPVERLRRRLRDCCCVGRCLEGDKLSGRLVSAIISTVDGLD